MGKMLSKPTMTMTDIDTSNRLLFIINNKVIDATDILDNHPGGNEVLLRNRGKHIDIALYYHSKSTRKQILKHAIGTFKRD